MLLSISGATFSAAPAVTLSPAAVNLAKIKAMTSDFTKIATSIDEIDQQISAYKDVISQLKAEKNTSFSAEKQAKYKDILMEHLTTVKALIESTAYWLYDSRQATELKQIRVDLTDLLSKYAGRWYGWQEKAPAIFSQYAKSISYSTASILTLTVARYLISNNNSSEATK